jgi:hypothetical protein
LNWKDLARDNSWVDFYSKNLLAGRINRGEVRKGTYQLTVGAFNMGDIARQSHLPDGSHSKDISQNLLLRLIAENSCHIMLIQESASLQFPALAAFMESYGLTAKFSTSGNLCIVARALQPLPEKKHQGRVSGLH